MPFQLITEKMLRPMQLLVFIVAVLYLGRTLFVPLSFGLLVAIIAYPVCKRLEGKGWSRTLAITFLISITILVFLSLFFLLVYEAKLIFQDLPAIKDKFSLYLGDAGQWLYSALGINKTDQAELLNSLVQHLKENSPDSLQKALGTLSAASVNLLLIPVFAALFLFHRATFVKFIEMLAGNKYHDKIRRILEESILSYFKFVKGTLIVYCIVGALNSFGLLLLGIEHAVLFGTITAFMTFVPYIGIIISAALPVTIALITKDSAWYAIGVVGVFSFVQYLEANIIFPKVVGQQLGLSTMAMIVAMIIGTLLWGIAGMILFVPFAAILKVVSDNIVELRPLNVLLNREDERKVR